MNWRLPAGGAGALISRDSIYFAFPFEEIAGDDVRAEVMRLTLETLLK